MLTRQPTDLSVSISKAANASHCSCRAPSYVLTSRTSQHNTSRPAFRKDEQIHMEDTLDAFLYHSSKRNAVISWQSEHFGTARQPCVEPAGPSDSKDESVERREKSRSANGSLYTRPHTAAVLQSHATEKVVIRARQHPHQTFLHTHIIIFSQPLPRSSPATRALLEHQRSA